jgi:hypothetical protein
MNTDNITTHTIEQTDKNTTNTTDSLNSFFIYQNFHSNFQNEQSNFINNNTSFSQDNNSETESQIKTKEKQRSLSITDTQDIPKIKAILNFN